MESLRNVERELGHCGPDLVHERLVTHDCLEVYLNSSDDAVTKASVARGGRIVDLDDRLQQRAVFGDVALCPVLESLLCQVPQVGNVVAITGGVLP